MCRGGVWGSSGREGDGDCEGYDFLESVVVLGSTLAEMPGLLSPGSILTATSWVSVVGNMFPTRGCEPSRLLAGVSHPPNDVSPSSGSSLIFGDTNTLGLITSQN